MSAAVIAPAVAAIVIIAAITGITIICVALETGQDRHMPRHALADPRDRSDPDGTLWLAALRTGPPGAAAPFPIAGQLPMGPPDPDPAATGPLPHAVGTWGMTASELTAELAARHLLASTWAEFLEEGTR